MRTSKELSTIVESICVEILNESRVTYPSIIKHSKKHGLNPEFIAKVLNK